MILNIHFNHFNFKKNFELFLNRESIRFDEIFNSDDKSKTSYRVYDTGVNTLEIFLQQIQYNYSILNRLKTLSDYNTVTTYAENASSFFNCVSNRRILSSSMRIQLALSGGYFLSDTSFNKISLSNSVISFKKIWRSRRFKPISLSNSASHSILLNKRGYYLKQNFHSLMYHLDQLDKDVAYTFVFSSDDKNFAAVDPDGNFLYISNNGQSLIKLKLHIDSYLDIKYIFKSSFIVTDNAVYNFSGDKISHGSNQYVYHFKNDRITVRENLYLQKLEVISNLDKNLKQFELYGNRLIHQVFLNEGYLIINYEDDLIQFIHLKSKRHFSVFTREKIRQIGVTGYFVYILQVDHSIEIIELKK